MSSRFAANVVICRDHAPTCLHRSVPTRQPDVPPYVACNAESAIRPARRDDCLLASPRASFFLSVSSRAAPSAGSAASRRPPPRHPPAPVPLSDSGESMQPSCACNGAAARMKSAIPNHIQTLCLISISSRSNSESLFSELLLVGPPAPTGAGASEAASTRIPGYSLGIDAAGGDNGSSGVTAGFPAPTSSAIALPPGIVTHTSPDPSIAIPDGG